MLIGGRIFILQSARRKRDFLFVAYREMKRLEREILLRLHSVQNEILATKSPSGSGMSASPAARKPILVKVAPDLSWEALEACAAVLSQQCS